MQTFTLKNSVNGCFMFEIYLKRMYNNEVVSIVCVCCIGDGVVVSICCTGPRVTRHITRDSGDSDNDLSVLPLRTS